MYGEMEWMGKIQLWSISRYSHIHLESSVTKVPGHGDGQPGINSYEGRTFLFAITFRLALGSTTAFNTAVK
jgi:hypothetical protein